MADPIFERVAHIVVGYVPEGEQTTLTLTFFDGETRLLAFDRDLAVGLAEAILDQDRNRPSRQSRLN